MKPVQDIGVDETSAGRSQLSTIVHDKATGNVIHVGTGRDTKRSTGSTGSEGPSMGRALGEHGSLARIHRRRKEMAGGCGLQDMLRQVPCGRIFQCKAVDQVQTRMP